MMIKANRTELDNAFRKKRLYTDAEIAEAISVSQAQVWRVMRVPENSKKHNDPGVSFVSGTLNLLGVRNFHKYFYLV